jgi:flagellar biosynthesis/type III secretory pathway ATPase
MTATPEIRGLQQGWGAELAAVRERVADLRPLQVEGVLSRMVGMTLEAVGCEAAVGSRCLIDGRQGQTVEAEVVGFSGERLFLMPTGDMRGLMPGARVRPADSVSEVHVGEALSVACSTAPAGRSTASGRSTAARRSHSWASRSTRSSAGRSASRSTSASAR